MTEEKKKNLKADLIARAEWKDIDRDWVENCIDMYREINDTFFDWQWLFDLLLSTDWAWTRYIMCSCRAFPRQIPEWIDVVIDWDLVWWFSTPEELADYMINLEETTRELTNS